MIKIILGRNFDVCKLLALSCKWEHFLRDSQDFGQNKKQQRHLELAVVWQGCHFVFVTAVANVFWK